MAYIDKVSIDRIKLLHPKVRQEAEDIYMEIADRLTRTDYCRFTQTFRTEAEQNALYAIGRTKGDKRPIVTRAKAYESFHSFGLAIDFAMVSEKHLSYDMKKDSDRDLVPDWMEVVEVFRQHGWSWGGLWSGAFKDYPHFEKSFSYSVRDLKKLHDTGKVDSEGYVIIP